MDIICEKLTKDYPGLGENARVFRVCCIERQIKTQGCCRKYHCKTGRKVLEEAGKSHLKPPTKPPRTKKETKYKREYIDRLKGEGRYERHTRLKRERKRRATAKMQAEKISEIMNHLSIDKAEIAEKIKVSVVDIDRVLSIEKALPPGESKRLSTLHRREGLHVQL